MLGGDITSISTEVNIVNDTAVNDHAGAWDVVPVSPQPSSKLQTRHSDSPRDREKGVLKPS
jgi:hypothetical protein